MRQVYGFDLPASDYFTKGVIESPTTTTAGNVVLRVGNVIESGEGWKQVAYVVLTVEEARALAQALSEAVAEASRLRD